MTAQIPFCASFEFGAGLHNPLDHGALPGVVTVKLAELQNLAATTEALFAEAADEHCGRQAILNRLVEVLIIQLRELMDQGRIQTGLLAGLSNPRLVKAINAIHADPRRAWRLTELALLANMSRARLRSISARPSAPRLWPTSQIMAQCCPFTAAPGQECADCFR